MDAASSTFKQETSGSTLGLQSSQITLAPMNTSQLKILFKNDGPETQQVSVEKFNIAQLVERERFYRDNALWTQMLGCYADNSSVTLSWFHGSGKDFVAASSKMGVFSPHKIYDSLIWLNGTRAVSITMATIQLRSDLGGVPVELDSDMKLLYRVQKLEGTWKIISLDAIYEKDIILPLSSTKAFSLSADDLLSFRKSYANLAYLLSKEGISVSNELPGIDKPESIGKLYSAVDEWLSSI
jgi:hypothetical protein